MILSEKKGIIFDIKRFSVHDGQGIRVTVFFKGCPLSCVWCQNPEGISLIRRPLYFEKKCIHCGTCLKTASSGGVTLEDGNIRLNVEADEDWNKIIDACPAVAIAMDSKEYTISQVMEEVNKEKVFFRDDGGVTLSGGEPLLQNEFAIELLKTLKSEKINTAIETALNVDEKVIRQMLKYTDTVFADFKIFDNRLHKKYAGVSNNRIRENLKLLLTSEKRKDVIVRTPLIPGITALKDNLANIAEYISDIYEDVHYELLNYNPLAEAKYHFVDRKFCFDENPKMYTKDEMRTFGKIVTDAGVKNLILDI